jgi:iron complex outermembrane receptor protein
VRAEPSRPPRNRTATARRTSPAVLPPAVPAVKNAANALGTYNPALDLPGLKLPPGTTETTAGPVDGYRALSAFSAIRTMSRSPRLFKMSRTFRG